MKIKKTLFLLALSCAMAGLGRWAFPSEDLLAINILLEPDEVMSRWAKLHNDLLREDYPAGFALEDGSHAAHITVLQGYIRERDLGKIIDAVKSVSAELSISRLRLSAGEMYFSAPGAESLGMAGVGTTKPPELVRFQKAVVDAVRPFLAGQASSGAFVPNDDGSQISHGMTASVQNFIRKNTGEHYSPHVTLGFCRERFCRPLVKRSKPSFNFGIRGVGIYQMGESGTARKKLWSSENLDSEKGRPSHADP